MAESISYMTCTECGNMSAPQNTRGWSHTMCKNCREVSLNETLISGANKIDEIKKIIDRIMFLLRLIKKGK